MVRKELIRRMAEVMRENDIRKPISIPKQVFHISDDDGNHKDFTVKKIDKTVLYTADDIEAILDTLQFVIQEAVKTGEEISIRGFGTLGLRYRKPRIQRNVMDGQPVEVEGRYVPHFLCGNDLKRCAQVYEQSLIDRKINEPLPIFHEIEDGE